MMGDGGGGQAREQGSHVLVSPFILFFRQRSPRWAALPVSLPHFRPRDSGIQLWCVDAKVQTKNARQHTPPPILVFSPWELYPPREGCHLWSPVLFWSFPWWRSDSPAGDHTLEDKQGTTHILSLFRKLKVGFEDYLEQSWKFNFCMGYSVKLAWNL